MFFQKKGHFRVIPEYCIMYASKPLIILFVNPFSLSVFIVVLRILFNKLIIPFKQKLNKFGVTIISGSMQQGAILIIEDSLNLLDKVLGQRFGQNIVRAFDGLKNIFCCHWSING